MRTILTVNLGNTRELKDKLTHNSNRNHKVFRKRSNRKCKIFVEKKLKNSSEKYKSLLGVNITYFYAGRLLIEKISILPGLAY